MCFCMVISDIAYQENGFSLFFVFCKKCHWYLGIANTFIYQQKNCE